MANTNKKVTYTMNVDTKKADKNLKNTSKGVDSLGESFDNMGGSVGNAASGIKTFFTTLMSNPIVAVIGAISALVAGMYEYSKASLKAAKDTTAVANAMGVTREEANGLRKEINVISAVWDKDYNEVLQASSALMHQFGISGTESLELINAGFEKGADVNGEYLDLLKEYPAQLKTVGLSAKESIAVITQTQQQGLFSDKGIDAIKEAGLRLREMTTATSDALNGLGLSSKQIQKDLESGNKSLFDVMQQVSKQMKTLPQSSAKVGTAIADIFGGPGEDAGIQFLENLGEINTSLDELPSNLSDAEIASNDLTEAWARFNDSMLEQGGAIDNMSTFIKLDFAKTLNQWNDVMKSNISWWEKTYAIIDPTYGSMVSYGEAINKAYDSTYELNTLMSDENATFEDKEALLKKLNDEYDILIKKVSADGKVTDKESVAVKRLGGNIQLLTGIINDLKKARKEEADAKAKETQDSNDAKLAEKQAVIDKNNNLKLLKQQLAFYKEKNKNAIVGEKNITKDMVIEDNKRVKNVESRELQIAALTYEIEKKAAGDNVTLLKIAEANYGTAKIKARNAANKEILKNEQLFNDQLAKGKEQLFQTFLEQNKKELADMDIQSDEELKKRLAIHEEAYNKEIELVKETANEEKWSKEKLTLELLKIETKYNDDVEKLTDSLADYKAKSLQQQLVDLTNNRNLELKLANGTITNEQSLADTKLKINKKYYEDVIAITKKAAMADGVLTDEEIANIKELIKAQNDLNENTKDVEGQRQLTISETIGVIQDSIGAIQNLMNAIYEGEVIAAENRLNRLNEEYNAEVEMYKNKSDRETEILDLRLAKGQMSQRQHDIELIKLQMKNDAIQKKAAKKAADEKEAIERALFEKKKKMDIANVWIDAAMGIMNIWSTAMELGPIAGPIAAGVLTALILGMAGVQTSNISSQEFGDGGLLQGPSHVNGGIRLNNNEIGEGGEFIVNKVDTKKNLSTLQAINNGETITNNQTINFDYDKLATLLNDKKVILTQDNLVDDENDRVLIDSLTSF